LGERTTGGAPLARKLSAAEGGTNGPRLTGQARDRQRSCTCLVSKRNNRFLAWGRFPNLPHSSEGRKDARTL